MTASSVAELIDALGVTPEDLAALKGVRLVWKKLEALRLKAEKGTPKDLAAYKELLEKNLVAARKNQPTEDPEQASKGFWAWYVSCAQELGVPAIEEARGSSHSAWCEKWLISEYQGLDAAISRTIEMPSQVNFEEAKSAANKMLRAYVEAFEKT
jgi:hypothetical protein